MAEARPNLKPISKARPPPRSALLSGSRPSKQPRQASKDKEPAASTPADPKAGEPVTSALPTPTEPTIVVLSDPEERTEEAATVSGPRPAESMVPRPGAGLVEEPSRGEVPRQESSAFEKIFSGMIPWAIAHGGEKDFANLYNAPTVQTLGHIGKMLMEMAPCVVKASSEISAAQKLVAEAEARRELAEGRIGIMTGDLSLARKAAEDAAKAAEDAKRAAEDAKNALEATKAERDRFSLRLTQAEEESRHLRHVHGACHSTLAQAKAEAAALISQAREEAEQAKKASESAVESFLESQEFEEERTLLYQGGYKAAVLEMKAAFPELDLSSFGVSTPEPGADGADLPEAEVAGPAEAAPAEETAPVAEVVASGVALESQRAEE